MGDLAAQYGARVRVTDEHMLQVPPAAFNGPITFRLQLFTAPGLQPVAMATQAEGDAGSIVNFTERALAFVWQEHFADEGHPPLWVVCVLGSSAEELPHLMLVTFGTISFEEHRLADPRWLMLSPKELLHLTGSPADLDRGVGYVPQVEEVPDEIDYVMVPLSEIPQAHPFRQPGCMSPGLRQAPQIRTISRRTRFGRLLRTKPCCWYHAGDWHKVNNLAESLIAEARTTHPQNLHDHIVSSLENSKRDSWSDEALWSLFSAPVDLSEGHRTFINGQHRVQAMRDQGVSRTVVVRFVSPD
jgi:hypothetical protein